MKLRQFATPLTIGSFTLMAVTGLLLFFDIQLGLNVELHEWFSWAFLAGVVLHVTLNLPAFKRYFNPSIGLAIIAVIVLILGVSLSIHSESNDPLVLSLHAVSRAPLTKVAALADKPVAKIVGDLRAAGFAAAQDTATIEQLSGDDFDTGSKMIRIIFGP